MNPARFYFANLGADIVRCVAALDHGDEGRYRDSLARARRTLGFLRASNRPEAYEEGLLLLRGLEYARQDNTLDMFLDHTNKLITVFVR